MNQVAESQERTIQETSSDENSLPRRDLWLLPLLSLCTILVLLCAAEGCARILWPRRQDACEVNDGRGSTTFFSHCVSRSKIPEGPWISNVTNECGYHNSESCGPKPPSSIRLVTLGSSFSYGYHVDAQQSYTYLLKKQLEVECHEPIEVQNLGIPGKNIWEISRRMDEALALKPDTIIVSFMPFDFLKIISPEEMAQLDNPSYQRPLAPASVDYGIPHRVIVPLKNNSRFLMMMQHFMYEDFELHIKLFLLHGDEAGYIKTPFSPLWQDRLRTFDILLGWMQAKANAASVPLLLLIGPDTNEVAAIRAKPRPSVDPYAFNDALKTIAARHHVTVIDPLQAVASQPKPFANYYLIDGHMNAGGQKILEQVVNTSLLSKAIPQLSGCRTM